MASFRTRLLFFLVTVACAPGILAQRAYLAPQVGMRLGGSWEDVLEQEYDVDEHVSVGVAFGIRTDETGGVEFHYSGQPTSVRVTDTLFARRDFDLDIHDFSLTGWREFGRPGQSLQPVALGFAGVTWLRSDDADDDETTFMIGGGGGIRVWTADRRLGFRLDGRVTFSFLPNSTEVACVLPGGCLFAWNDDVLIQTDLAAGVMLGLGGARKSPQGQLHRRARPVHRAALHQR